ncbi:hypothetical protein [Amycolatopsis jejuensis]|uniref:hypothetical protein n=1 Tax=Amycolatopsis jejuensis TaxID=330084 RepID=UPI000AA2BE10|nr:hypothetical protein [Amycolatopsis jejuensis]
MTYGPGYPPPHQQPPPQPVSPQWGTPQWPGPPPGYPSGRASTGAPPPKRRRTGLIIGICLAGVVVLAAAGITIFVVVTDDSVEVHRPAGGPEVVVQAYVDAVNQRDPIGLQNVNCHPSTEYPATRSVAGFATDGVRMRLGRKAQASSGWQYYEVEVTRTGRPPSIGRLEFSQEEGGTWCVPLTGLGLPVNLPG